MNRRALLLPCLLLQGCATLFTGARQEIAFTAAPPGATVVVLSGTPATVALKAKGVSDFKDVVVNLLGSSLPPDARQVLLAVSAEELLTQLVLWTRLSDLSPDTVSTAGEVLTILAQLPGSVRDRASTSSASRSSPRRP